MDNACHISKRTTSSQFEQAAFIAISCSYRIFNSRTSLDWDLLDHHINFIIICYNYFCIVIYLSRAPVLWLLVHSTPVVSRPLDMILYIVQHLSS